MKKKNKIINIFIITLLIFFSNIENKSLAQEKFPNKAIEMTILFGGTAKTIGEVIADGLQKELKQPVVGVSRLGAGGATGYQYIQSRPASGYEIVFNSNSISTTYHGGQIPFDYKAFEPIAGMLTEVPVLAVKADRFKSLNELVDFAKKNPGKLNVGISGKGSFTHLASAVAFDAIGIKVNYIPYGDGKAPIELLAGRIDAAIQWPNQFRSFDQAGQLKMLAVTSSKRIKSDPNVPTMQELGYKNVDVIMWRGLAAKKGISANEVKILEEAAKKYAASAAYKDASEKIGFEINFLNSQDFSKKIASDDLMIGKLSAELGLKEVKN